MRKKITIHDVARKAKYSITVVSHALNDNPRINEATRKKIKGIARKMGYHPNIFARSFARQCSELIGVVVPGILTSFYPEVIRGIKERLWQANYGFILAVSDDEKDEEKKAIEFLKQRQVDGFIIAPCQDEGNKAYYKQLIKGNVPVVFIDRFLEGLSANSVVTDNVTGGYLAVKYLLELGHRRIGLLRAAFDCSTTKERIKGYWKALQEQHIARDMQLVKASSYNIGGDSYAADSEVIKAYLQMQERPTALFVIHDAIAVSVMSRLLNLGLRIPQDISIIGYDDLRVVRHLPVPLTTVSQPKAEMGRIAVEMLLREINEGSAKVQQRRLAPQLVVRSSCGNVIVQKMEKKRMR